MTLVKSHQKRIMEKKDLIKQEEKHKRFPIIIVNNLLVILILLAVAIGVGLGLGLRNQWSHDDYMKPYYLEFPGRILMNLLQLLTLPLIVSSVVSTVASLEAKATSKLGCMILTYYLSTTVIAVIVGIVLVLATQPGTYDVKNMATPENSTKISGNALNSVLDIISQCFPENLVSACFEKVFTKVITVNSAPRLNETSKMTYTVKLEKPVQETERGMNILGLVIFSIVLGSAINFIGKKGEPLKEFFQSLNTAMMILISVSIWYTPIGIMFLVASKFVSTRDIAGIVSGLAKYFAVILIALGFHSCLILPLIYFVFTQKNPYIFAFTQSKALFTAWSTASSLATLPVTMECLINDNIHIDIVKFVVPVGASVNMDGAAIYQAIACIFIAQVNGVDLGLADIIIIALTSVAGAVGVAGVPQAGLVVLVVVMTSVGLPAEDISIILPIDWLVDRFLTAINVWGDCVGAGIMDHNFSFLLSTPGETQTEVAGEAVEEPKVASAEVQVESSEIKLGEPPSLSDVAESAI